MHFGWYVDVAPTSTSTNGNPNFPTPMPTVTHSRVNVLRTPDTSPSRTPTEGRRADTLSLTDTIFLSEKHHDIVWEFPFAVVLVRLLLYW